MANPVVPPVLQLDPEHSTLNSSSPTLAERQSRMRARAERVNAPTVDPELCPYGISDLMILHGLSRRTIVRLYEHESGIEILPDLRPPDRRRCVGRRYRTLRVPRHVYLRVKHRMQVR